MHFGEFLVQKKILSAHQVLKALAEQRRRRRFLPLLLVEQNSLEDYRALRYYAQAEQSSEAFLEVLVEEKLISKEQCSRIRSTWTRSGPPLGSLLVEMGFMDESTRVELLDSFEAERALESSFADLAKSC